MIGFEEDEADESSVNEEESETESETQFESKEEVAPLEKS